MYRHRSSHPSRTLSWAALLVVVALSLGSAGCLFSQQAGKPSQGDAHLVKKKLGNISFHFRGTMNYLSMALRLGLLIGLIWLTRRAFKTDPRQHVAVLAALVVLGGGAAWFFGSGAMRVAAYRIDVDEQRLAVRFPMSTNLRLTWKEIAELRVEGLAVYQVNDSRGVFQENKPMYNKWKTIEIVTQEGVVHNLDLTALTVVQRSNLVKAIVNRSGRVMKTVE